MDFLYLIIKHMRVSIYFWFLAIILNIPVIILLSKYYELKYVILLCIIIFLIYVVWYRYALSFIDNDNENT